MSDTAALALAPPDGAATKPKGRLAVLLPVAVLTLVAVAAGAGTGWIVGGINIVRARQAEAEKAATPAAPAPVAGPNAVLALAPIVTNLAAPDGVVLRLQASLVFDKTRVPDPTALGAQVTADTLAFLRSLELAQVEGPRGLLHLREDLTERAQLREPAVSAVLVDSLIAQ